MSMHGSQRGRPPSAMPRSGATVATQGGGNVPRSNNTLLVCNKCNRQAIFKQTGFIRCGCIFCERCKSEVVKHFRSGKKSCPMCRKVVNPQWKNDVTVLPISGVRKPRLSHHVIQSAMAKNVAENDARISYEGMCENVLNGHRELQQEAQWVMSQVQRHLAWQKKRGDFLQNKLNQVQQQAKMLQQESAQYKAGVQELQEKNAQLESAKQSLVARIAELEQRRPRSSSSRRSHDGFPSRSPFANGSTRSGQWSGHGPADEFGPLDMDAESPGMNARGIRQGLGSSSAFRVSSRGYSSSQHSQHINKRRRTSPHSSSSHSFDGGRHSSSRSWH